MHEFEVMTIYLFERQIKTHTQEKLGFRQDLGEQLFARLDAEVLIRQNK